MALLHPNDANIIRGVYRLPGVAGTEDIRQRHQQMVVAAPGAPTTNYEPPFRIAHEGDAIDSDGMVRYSINRRAFKFSTITITEDITLRLSTPSAGCAAVADTIAGLRRLLGTPIAACAPGMSEVAVLSAYHSI
ncbi:hypothetical protein Y032_0228g2865 [Ancylostoma ceylanicum]|uniref:Uncharacterized protein n=1 Tax=Ancylostoma ceylanicum TaxID=53326 RepID=A0A016SH83_9BILA|nr:hypothetical protein Y032_0228g2865 [Ancylostoma ceylanicum]